MSSTTVRTTTTTTTVTSNTNNGRIETTTALIPAAQAGFHARIPVVVSQIHTQRVPLHAQVGRTNLQQQAYINNISQNRMHNNGGPLDYPVHRGSRDDPAFDRRRAQQSRTDAALRPKTQLIPTSAGLKIHLFGPVILYVPVFYLHH